MQHRIVVFTGDLSYSVRAGILAIDHALGNASWLVIVHSPRKALPTLVRNQLRNLRINGWRWIPYQIRELVKGISLPRERSGIPNAPSSESAADAFAARANIRIERVTRIHADTTLSLVRDFAPELGLSMAAPILRESLFSIPRRGTLNLHKGKLPQYRGMPPAFWELWHDEQEIGCTIHLVDARLDTGDVIASSCVPRQRFSDVRGLQLTLEAQGIRLMRDAAMAVLENRAASCAQSEGGQTFRKPTLRQISMLERKLRLNLPKQASRTTRRFKHVAYRTATFAWNHGGRFVARPRIKVLLYHRVTDGTRDNLCVGIAQFDRQMAYVSRYCRVLSIEEVLSQNPIPRSDRPLVCVTFDDGYLDNFEHAMPILLRNRVPAAFFVTTGILGTDKPFPHDVKRGNARPPVMSWEHVRELHAKGFTIGSHSVNHIDCAAEPENIVRQELVQSLDELRDRLALRQVLFAYPYGGRQHITPDRLRLIRQVGYMGCLSAYGGTNVGHVDPFNVVRGGIHWEVSDQAFQFQCLGLV